MMFADESVSSGVIMTPIYDKVQCDGTTSFAKTLKVSSYDQAT